MYVLPPRKQIEVLRLLTDGSSVSSTSRFSGVHRDTCTRLMLRFGYACEQFLDVEMRDLEVEHFEIDEMWTFCRKKDKRVTGEEPDADRIGSFYLFVALDEATRLIPAYRVDKRNEEATVAFMCDLRNRIKIPKPHLSDSANFKKGEYKRVVRISTDSFPAYPKAVDFAFGPYASHGLLKKDFNTDGLTISKKVVAGEIEEDKITTSLVERSNLTTRTFMKRYMRRTLGFSKKLENLKVATAVHIAAYNYCNVHKTLKTTPAVAAGLIGKRWRLFELYDHLRERWPEFFLCEQKGAA